MLFGAGGVESEARLCLASINKEFTKSRESRKGTSERIL